MRPRIVAAPHDNRINVVETINNSEKEVEWSINLNMENIKSALSLGKGLSLIKDILSKAFNFLIDEWLDFKGNLIIKKIVSKIKNEKEKEEEKEELRAKEIEVEIEKAKQAKEDRIAIAEKREEKKDRIAMAMEKKEEEDKIDKIEKKEEEIEIEEEVEEDYSSYSDEIC